MLKISRESAKTTGWARQWRIHVNSEKSLSPWQHGMEGKLKGYVIQSNTKAKGGRWYTKFSHDIADVDGSYCIIFLKWFMPFNELSFSEGNSSVNPYRRLWVTLTDTKLRQHTPEREWCVLVGCSECCLFSNDIWIYRWTSARKRVC